MRGNSDKSGLQDGLCSIQPHSIYGIMPGCRMWHESTNAVITYGFIVAANNDPAGARESDRYKKIDS